LIFDMNHAGDAKILGIPIWACLIRGIGIATIHDSGMRRILVRLRRRDIGGRR
jgi:hypothetical protein